MDKLINIYDAITAAAAAARNTAIITTTNLNQTPLSCLPPAVNNYLLSLSLSLSPSLFVMVIE